MPDFLNRDTKVLSLSLSPADVPPPITDFIENPDLTAVAGEPNKYWITQPFPDDTVTLASPAEQTAIDAAINQVFLDDNRTIAADIATTDPAAVGMQNRGLIEVFNKRDNFLVNRIEELQATLLDMKATTGAVQTIRDAIPANFLATNTRDRSAAVADYVVVVESGQADDNA